MNILLIILIALAFAKDDVIENKSSSIKSLQDLKLKLNMKPQDLLPSDPYARANKVTPQAIDSIKLAAKNYIPEPVSLDDVIIMETTMGTMKLRYFPDVAERHCYNFKKLANSGFYDKTQFHRVIRNFMIQGGDILSRDESRKNDGTGDPGWTVNSEFNQVKHTKGVLSMARGSSENSAGSQFFICHNDAPWLDGKYTAFGEVIENLHIIDRIAEAATDYTTAKANCYEEIPDEEVSKPYWVNVIDPKTRSQLFCKIPVGKKKDNYKQELLSLLRSDNPVYPITIKKIRVVSAEVDD